MSKSGKKKIFTRESEVCGEKIFFSKLAAKRKSFQCRAAAPPANIVPPPRVPPSFCFRSSAPPPHQSALPPRLRQAQRRRRRSPARKELTIAVSVHGGRTKLGTATGMTRVGRPDQPTRPRLRLCPAPAVLNGAPRHRGGYAATVWVTRITLPSLERRRVGVLRWRGSEIGLSECEITLCRFLKKFRAVGSFSKV